MQCAFRWASPFNRWWHIVVVVIAVVDLGLLNWGFWSTAGFVFSSKKLCRLLEFQARQSTKRCVRSKAYPSIRISSPKLTQKQMKEKRVLVAVSVSACQALEAEIHPRETWVRDKPRHSVLHDLQFRKQMIPSPPMISTGKEDEPKVSIQSDYKERHRWDQYSVHFGVHSLP